MEISTPEDWWTLVDQEWFNLLGIMHSYLPLAEFEDAKKAKQAKDWQILHTHFEHAWWNAPDSRHIHEIPGWGDLCDLCSEHWVFDKE